MATPSPSPIIKIAAILAAASIGYFIYHSFFTSVSGVVFTAVKHSAGTTTSVVASATVGAERVHNRLSSGDISAIALSVGAVVIGALAFLAKRKFITGRSADSMAAVTQTTEQEQTLINAGYGELAVTVHKIGIEAANVLNHNKTFTQESRESVTEALRNPPNTVEETYDFVLTLGDAIMGAIEKIPELERAQRIEYSTPINEILKLMTSETIETKDSNARKTFEDGVRGGE